MDETDDIFNELFSDDSKKLDEVSKNIEELSKEAEDIIDTKELREYVENLQNSKETNESSESQESVETKDNNESDDLLLKDLVSDNKESDETGVTTNIEKTTDSKSDEIVINENKTEIDLMPESGIGKVVITIYSHKGHGKTDAALSFKGKIAAISFDYKTKPVAVKRYKQRILPLEDISSTEDLINKCNQTNDWIIVWDGKKYYDESSPEQKLSSSEITFEYIIKLFDLISKLNPDWVVIDGTEILHEICEMLMRYRNGLAPFQGISNRNLWKERKMYMRQIHKMAIESCKKGVIYTLYPEGREIKIVDGEIVDKDEIPKWLDIVLYETDTVIKCEQRWTEGIRKWFVRVESNKSPILKLKEGIDIDVTNKFVYDEILDKGGDIFEL